MSERSRDRCNRNEPGHRGAARVDLLNMLPQQGGLKLLEIGAGDGATLREAKRRGLADYAVALDLVAPSPGEPVIDHFQVGDAERIGIDLPVDYFDIVIAGDVLEHLVDPWRMVSRLVELLKPDGLFVASIPNFRNHRALAPILLQGDFRYESAGLLDRTHLRFFCRSNVVDLFRRAGLEIEAVEENMGAYGLRHRLLDAITFGVFHDFFVFQFLVRARKPARRT